MTKSISAAKPRWQIPCSSVAVSVGFHGVWPLQELRTGPSSRIRISGPPPQISLNVRVIVVDCSLSNSRGPCVESHITAWKVADAASRCGACRNKTAARERKNLRRAAERRPRDELPRPPRSRLARSARGFTAGKSWLCRSLLQGPKCSAGLQRSVPAVNVWRGVWERGACSNEVSSRRGRSLIFACGWACSLAEEGAWLGFRPAFAVSAGKGAVSTGSGRRRRGTALSAFLRWWHRFRQPAGVRCPRSLAQGSAVLSHQGACRSVGCLEALRGGRLFPSRWNRLVASPVAGGRRNCPSKRCGEAVRQSRSASNGGNHRRVSVRVGGKSSAASRQPAKVRGFAAGGAARWRLS